MGAFCLIKKTSEIKTERLKSTLAGQMAAQGFSRPKVFDTDAYELYVYPKLAVAGENYFETHKGDFCACTGTLIYRGVTGEAALARLYAAFDPDRMELADFYGAFCVLIRKEGKIYLFLDRLGIYKAYHDRDQVVWSSSLLAVLATLERKEVNPQAVYEYVFQGATYGVDTVISHIHMVDADRMYRFDRDAVALARPVLPRGITNDDTVEQHLERSLSNLRQCYRHIVECFGDSIDTALSGGYDSRLTLALLLEQGVRPRVHVYGKASDADVQVARAIDASERLGLEHVDKSQFEQVSVDRFGEAAEANLHAFDGYPTDGLFADQSDLATRHGRCAHGELMLNGGGGEVFRNFYYLGDRSFTVRQFLWSFYSQFDPRVCTQQFSQATYHARLATKIKAALGIDRERLHRSEVEWLYPLFRCRYWMGRNNMINNRLGYALTPFVDYSVVRDAATVPIKYKNFGRFEARMIRVVSPKLAAYGSAYGHDFTQQPSFKHRLDELATMSRPPWLRRYSYRLRTRYRDAALPYGLTPPYRDAVLSGKYAYLDKFFAIEAVRDPAQLNRICTLELLFRTFNVDVPRI